MADTLTIEERRFIEAARRRVEALVFRGDLAAAVCWAETLQMDARRAVVEGRLARAVLADIEALRGWVDERVAEAAAPESPGAWGWSKAWPVGDSPERL